MARVDTAQLAVPAVTTTLRHRLIVPALNVTVPVASAVLGAELIAAVNVIIWFFTAGLADEVSVVVVEVFTTTSFTVAEFDVPNPASPR